MLIPAEVKRGKGKVMKNKVIIKQSVLALMLICVLAFVSCSFKGCNQDEPIEIPLDQVLQAVLNDTISDDAETDELLKATDSKSGFELISYIETETGVLVTFLVHAPDLYTVIKEIDENFVFETEEELKNALIEAIGKAQIVEREITVEFSLVDGEYVPMLSYEFFDAYYGGVFQLLNESFGDVNEEVAQ